MKLRFLLALMFLLIEGTFVGATCKKPTITVPVATPDFGGQQVTITWTTDVAADSLVGYGNPNAGTLTPITDLTGVTSHSVTIAGLIPATGYNWGIRSRAIDNGKPCSSNFYTFYNGPGGTDFTTGPPPAGPYDYTILAIGGHHVTQGYGMYYRINLATLVGAFPGPKVMKLLLTGLPPFTTVRWTDKQVIGEDLDALSTTTVPNDTVVLYDPGPKEAYILTNVGGTTPPGSYTITMTTTGSAHPTHSATWELTVDPASAPFNGIAFPNGTPSSYPAVPNLATYKASALTYGTSNCAEDFDSLRTIRPNDTSNLTPVGSSTTYGAWFYDGVQAYWNVQNLLNDDTDWEQCRANVKQVYRDGYVLPRDGAIFGFMMFTEGYYTDYLTSTEAADVTLINDLDSHMYAPYHGVMVDVSYLQRETAYAMKNAIYASEISPNSPKLFNNTTSFWRDYTLDHVLGHVDQICLSQNAQYFESFMVGLEAESLVQYYDLVRPDPRIPPAIKCLADYMYSSVYNTVTSDQGAFPYDKWRMLSDFGYGNGGSCMISLNMLIVPMYAWLFKNTGLTAYQTEGDEIWNHGVLFDGCQGGVAANLTGPKGNAGKQFSQQYYWGPSYVTWRSQPQTVKPARPAAPSGLSVILH
ncbi:MAG TPA: hypothetical protein VGH37_06540 [Candidatus Acidoferrum sp.]